MDDLIKKLREALKSPKATDDEKAKIRAALKALGAEPDDETGAMRQSPDAARAMARRMGTLKDERAVIDEGNTLVLGGIRG